MVLLLERSKLVVEGAGAAGVAAILAGKVEPPAERRDLRRPVRRQRRRRRASPSASASARRPPGGGWCCGTVVPDRPGALAALLGGRRGGRERPRRRRTSARASTSTCARPRSGSCFRPTVPSTPSASSRPSTLRGSRRQIEDVSAPGRGGGPRVGPRERKLEELRALLAEISDLGGARALLDWDERTMMPAGRRRGPRRADGDPGAVRHERLVADELGRLLDEAARGDGRAAVRLRRGEPGPRGAPRLGEGAPGADRAAEPRSRAPPRSPSTPGSRPRSAPTSSASSPTSSATST